MKAENHVRAGWAPIVQRAIDTIEAMGVQIFQVKEKFGELRIYPTRSNEEIDKVINQAVAECSCTCEVCGEPGTLRDGSWLRTLCDKHENS